MNPPEQYRNMIMNWLDGEMEDEERAAIDAELQRHAASRMPQEDIHDVVGLLRSTGLMEKTALHREILMRWVDDELDAQERACFKSMMDTDPELVNEAKAIRKLGDQVRLSFAMDTPLPIPEKFNRSILDSIAQIPQTGDEGETMAA